MFGSLRWFILAVPLLTVSAVSLAQTSASDTNTTCNFDSNKQLAMTIVASSSLPRRKHLVNPFLTARYGRRAANL